MKAEYRDYPPAYPAQAGYGQTGYGQAAYSGQAPQYTGYYGGYGYNAAPPQGYAQGYYYGGRPPTSTVFNDRFLKGLAIGAAAAYLLTNEGVQRATIKGAVKAWSVMQGGVEEVKERFKDAEAELRAAEATQGE